MQRVHVTDLDTASVRSIELGPRAMPGWNKRVRGWSVGGPGCDVVIAEALDGVELGVFPASNHLVLWGRVAPGARLPEIAMIDGPPFDGPDADGKVWFRFDGRPLRIGRVELRFE